MCIKHRGRAIEEIWMNGTVAVFSCKGRAGIRYFWGRKTATSPFSFFVFYHDFSVGDVWEAESLFPR